MPWDISAGGSETIEAGTAKYGEPLNLDGTLFLDGTAYVTQTATQAAAGDAAATGTGDTLAERTTAGAGEGVARGQYDDLVVPAGDTETIAAGAERLADTVFVDGSLNLDGELLVAGGLTDALAERTTAGAGEGVATGDADALAERLTLAAGVGVALGSADVFPFNSLARINKRGIDNSRRDDFSVQGTGSVDD